MFAVGKHSIAICDRCSKEIPYQDLQFEVVNGKKTGFKVCDECFDEDNPQWQLSKVKVNDPQAIRDPRPDTSNMGNLSPADREAIQAFFDSYTSGVPS